MFRQRTLQILIYLSCTLLVSKILLAAGVEEVARQVQQTYEKTQDLQMDFIQETYVEVLEQKVRKKGCAKFKKPGKFLIIYEGSRGREYWSDGKKLWVYQKGDKQVQLYSVNDERVPPEALSFLGGLGNLKRDFAVEEVDEKKWKNFKRKKDNLEWLELTPLQKRSQIQWLVMGFDSGTHLAKEVYIFNDSGNLSHYKFSGIQPNTAISDTEFKFKKEGVKEVKVKPIRTD